MVKCGACGIPILLATFHCENCGIPLCFRHFATFKEKYISKLSMLGTIPICEKCKNAADVLKRINND